MQVNSFKLIGGGFGGIEIEANEYLNSGNNVSIVDGVKRKRKIPLSKELLSKVQMLRYAFLNLTGHWVNGYSAYMDSDLRGLKSTEFDSEERRDSKWNELYSLWNRTLIDEVKISGGGDGFKIKGRIDITIDKHVVITTPVVYIDDDFSFFTMTIDLLNDICSDIISFINSASTPISAREFVKQLYSGDDDKILESDQKSDSELISDMIENLEKRGAIVIMENGDYDSLPSAGSGVSVHKSSNELDRGIDPYDDIDQEEAISMEDMEREQEEYQMSMESIENESIERQEIEQIKQDYLDDEAFFEREQVKIQVSQEDIESFIDESSDIIDDDHEANDLRNAEYSDNMPSQ